MLHDPVFHTALKNIAEYTFAVVPLEMALGLSLALLINQKIRGRNFFRSSFYFPSIASSVAITTIALYIFNADGLFNQIIGSNTPWFGDASTVIWSIVGLNAWTTSGTVMLFYLAALQAIPDDVYEAAAVDATGAWRTFWRITFPLLRPAHFFCLVVFGIGALKLFDQAFIVVRAARGGAELRDHGPDHLHLQRGVRELRLRSRGGRGRRLLPDHLRPDDRAAAHCRQAGGSVMLQTVAAAEPLRPAARLARTSPARRCSTGSCSSSPLIFFMPFIWTAITSFKTIPDSVNVTSSPAPMDDLGLAQGLG